MISARILARRVEQGRLRPDLDVVLTAAMLQGVTLPWIYRRPRGERGPLAAASASVDLVLAGAGDPLNPRGNAPAHDPHSRR